MLAGLIFATEDADDRPDTLAATLPFGGMTLLEYQVRLMVGAGAGLVLVAVGRVTPQLIATVARAARRGVPVEIVRSAEEAAELVPASARVLVMADSLITTDPVMDRMAAEGAEALLVTDDANSPAAIERLDMRDCWAGLARVPAHHLGAIARMPEDWDFQSALLRVAVQARAEHVSLTPGWVRGGHAVERSAQALASRGNVVLAALTERRTNWADRWIFTRIARVALPELVARGVPGWAMVAAGALGAIGAALLAALGWVGAGAVLALVAVALLSTGAAMAAVRGEERWASALEIANGAVFAALILTAGWTEVLDAGTAAAAVLALAGVGLQAVAERVPGLRRRWWASPAGQILLFAPFALAGFVAAGLAAVAIYAFSTVAAAVEASREKA